MKHSPHDCRRAAALGTPSDTPVPEPSQNSIQELGNSLLRIDSIFSRIQPNLRSLAGMLAHEPDLTDAEGRREAQAVRRQQALA